MAVVSTPAPIVEARRGPTALISPGRLLLWLWAAFWAVDHPVAPGIVIVGFAVGICISLASLVPGGLGIMESSMTAVFVSLGVPLEPAVVAVLIFRLAYYVLPLCVSLFVFHGLMGQVAKAAGAAAWSGAQGFDSPAPRR